MEHIRYWNKNASHKFQSQKNTSKTKYNAICLHFSHWIRQDGATCCQYMSPAIQIALLNQIYCFVSSFTYTVLIVFFTFGGCWRRFLKKSILLNKYKQMLVEAFWTKESLLRICFTKCWQISHCKWCTKTYPIIKSNEIWKLIACHKKSKLL